MFNITLIGANNPDLNVRKLDDKIDFIKVKCVISTKLRQRYHKTIYCKVGIYVFGDYDNSNTLVAPIEKYSMVTNTWENVSDMTGDRMGYCACAFMDDIFIIGGRKQNYRDFFNSCLKFDTKDNTWNDIATMKDVREGASCTVFEGKVVVSGGRRDFMFPNDNLNTVEAYDHISDTWSYLPNMIERRIFHSSVAYKNKLFVFGSAFGEGENSCEFYDSTCKKFVFLKHKSNSLKLSFTDIFETFCIGSKFIILRGDSAAAICYDVEKDEWSEEQLRATQNIICLGCTVVPKMLC